MARISLSKITSGGIASAFLLMITTPVPAAAQAVGINAAIKHEVQTRKVNQPALRRAKLKDRVQIGDYIKTSPDGVLQILLRDKTNFTVGKNAEATIDRFVYDPSQNASEVALSVTKGAFRFISGKPTRNRKGRSSVKTPVGSIGIRGTIFEGAVGAQAFNIARGEAIDRGAVAAFHPDATLVFLRGPGPDAEGDEISGAVDLRTPTGVYPLEKAGDAYFVPRRGAQPIGPFPLSSKGMRIFRELFDMTPGPEFTSGPGSSAYPGRRPSGAATPYPYPEGRFPLDPRGRPNEAGEDFPFDPGSILDRGDILTPRNPPVRGGPNDNPNAVTRQRDTAVPANRDQAGEAVGANQPLQGNRQGQEQDRNPNQNDDPPPPRI